MDTREVTYKYRLTKWTEIIRECSSSGQTVSAWCTEHNIKPNTYYYWLKRVREAACETLPSIRTGDNTFVPINISADAAIIDSASQESSCDIVLHFGAVTLEIRNNASSTLIENTLRALQNVR